MNGKWLVLLVVFFLAGSVVLSGCAGQQSTPQTTTVPTVSGTQKTTPVTGIQTVKPTVQVTIPVTGVFLKVSYLGSFSGTYSANGVVENVRNSGDRLYEITNATGNVTASFSKEDGSTKHDITVELWKNGKSLTSAKNSTAFGKVSINYKV